MNLYFNSHFKDGGIPLISNELIVMLPLDLSEIKRPHEAVRKLDPDFYDEYIEIVDAERSKTFLESQSIMFLILFTFFKAETVSCLLHF